MKVFPLPAFNEVGQTPISQPIRDTRVIGNPWAWIIPSHRCSYHRAYKADVWNNTYLGRPSFDEGGDVVLSSILRSFSIGFMMVKVKYEDSSVFELTIRALWIHFGFSVPIPDILWPLHLPVPTIITPKASPFFRFSIGSMQTPQETLHDHLAAEQEWSRKLLHANFADRHNYSGPKKKVAKNNLWKTSQNFEHGSSRTSLSTPWYDSASLDQLNSI